jgi:hypothetical protein
MTPNTWRKRRKRRLQDYKPRNKPLKSCALRGRLKRPLLLLHRPRRKPRRRQSGRQKKRRERRLLKESGLKKSKLLKRLPQ